MAGGTLQRAKSDVLVSGPSRLLDDLELHQIDLPTRICFFQETGRTLKTIRKQTKKQLFLLFGDGSIGR